MDGKGTSEVPCHACRVVVCTASEPFRQVSQEELPEGGE